MELLTAHLVVALVALVVIGGATRVMEAGLACPDWPLCYGVLLPGRQMNLQVFLEWFHRLDAFLVGLALLVLSGLSLRFRAGLPSWLPWASIAALGLVSLQGALGALTVIRLLEASTVTAHLVTALALVLLLSAMHQGLKVWSTPGRMPSREAPARLPGWWLPLVILSGLLVLLQCFLGGAMASQWAADRCFQAGEGCRWLSLHRSGAWPAALSLALLAVGSLALPAGRGWLRGFALVAPALAVVQILLGILTMRLQLAEPAVTIAHQLVAALLVAVVGALWGRSLASRSVCDRSLPLLEVVHG